MGDTTSLLLLLMMNEVSFATYSPSTNLSLIIEVYLLQLSWVRCMVYYALKEHHVDGKCSPISRLHIARGVHLDASIPLGGEQIERSPHGQGSSKN